MKYSALLKRAEKAVKKIESMQVKSMVHVISENVPFDHLQGLIIIKTEDEDESSDLCSDAVLH